MVGLRLLRIKRDGVYQMMIYLFIWSLVNDLLIIMNHNVALLPTR